MSAWTESPHASVQNLQHQFCKVFILLAYLILNCDLTMASPSTFGIGWHLCRFWQLLNPLPCWFAVDSNLRAVLWVSSEWSNLNANFECSRATRLESFDPLLQDWQLRCDLHDRNYWCSNNPSISRNEP